MKYPRTMTEDETLDCVRAGRSIARIGDGEFKIAAGKSIKSQRADPRLAERMRWLLTASTNCLVGIPRITPDSPKYGFWRPFEAYASYLRPQRDYGSSFITRPDSAPWIDRADYWARVRDLWQGRDVTLVRGSEKSLMACELVGARSVTEIIAPRQHAWAEHKALLAQIGRPRRVLLCLGPTATIMAEELDAAGVHAIDLGHIGMFLRRVARNGNAAPLEAKE